MPQIGYISSFLESEGVGFLRSADRPKELILFRRAAAEELADLVASIGLEVEFEVPAPARRPDDDEGAPDGPVEATAVRPHVAPPTGEAEPLATDTEPC